MTVAAALDWGIRHLADSDTPQLDSEVLLAHVLGVDRSAVLADPARTLELRQQQHYRSLLEQRAAGKPVAYLVGHKEFYGRTFRVNSSVLVPRPDSELLVELALARVIQGDSVVDVGTGSGCLGLSVAATRPDLDVHLVDLSAVALSLAAENAAAIGVPGVRLHRGDLWPELGLRPERTVVIANLPYVQDRQIDEDRSLRHEPRMALAGGSDGLEVIKRFLAELERRNFQPRTLLLEHDPSQAEALAQLGDGLMIQTHTDLAGRVRVTELSPASVPSI
jgi:release factor glutamine methyltransferase